MNNEMSDGKNEKNEKVVLSTDIVGLKKIAQGKVRDVYAIDDNEILLVATDRLSAFDVVMNQGIPEKGRILTQISVFWFEKLASIIPHHLISAEDSVIAARLESVGAVWTPELSGRTMLCKRTKPLPIEAVVRGYLSGSGWKEYKTSGSLWGHDLPPGLVESDKLPRPLFTPSTKAHAGHDEPMLYSQISASIGDYAKPVESAALALYQAAYDYAATQELILADTKFEFGVDAGGTLLLIDEALTPDSSRFWEASLYKPGGAQPSFDKQFVRDFLETVPGWNKQPPPPELPKEIIQKTAQKYQDAHKRLINNG
jgi:phosphoribosylaminoimidazole-succinocarboxamide synthase